MALNILQAVYLIQWKIAPEIKDEKSRIFGGENVEQMQQGDVKNGHTFPCVLFGHLKQSTPYIMSF